MSSVGASGKTDISHYANEACTRNQHAVTVVPDFAQLPQEALVVVNMPHLCRVRTVLL